MSSPISDLTQSLSGVEMFLDKLYSSNEDYESLQESLNDMESSKLSVSLSYTLCSLLFILGNLDQDNNKRILGEIERVKNYMTKLRNIEEGNSTKKRKITLDIAAASRMIQFQLLNADTVNSLESTIENQVDGDGASDGNME